jgi:glycosyltransferase involved in cell wall biosynthesis
MNVLFITSSYPTPGSPAAGIFVREHARAAAEHANVVVLHLERTEEAAGLSPAEPIAGENPPAWRVRYRARPAGASVALHLLGALRGWRAVRRSGFRPDILHAHFFLAGVPAVLLGLLTRTPVVITEQWSVFLPESPQRLTPALRASARWAYARARLVLPVSEALRRGIESIGARARFRIVPNVVDTTLFAPGTAPRNGRLLTVGLFVESKGYEILFCAVAALAGRGRPVDLDVIGDGPGRESYVRLVRELGIEDRVSFIGFLPKAEVAERMRKAELFVLASRYDNNPCVVIEAMASGLPVVATAVGGIPEMVDGSSGRLAAPRDPERLADEIAAALDGVDAFDRVAIAASAKRRYGLEHVGAELADVYANASAR